MLISTNWLKQFVDLEGVTPELLAERLTIHSVEVEEIIELGQNLEHVVVGKVATVQKHPNADALNICTVEFGQDHPVQIVCGGSNVTEGMLCALGLIGAKVKWHGEGELITLKKAKIRDAESYGMICAVEEIGLGAQFPQKDDKEIMDISYLDVVVGTPLKEALGLNDVLIDVENKTMTHRPDLWGHFGMAREVSAIFDRKLSEYKTTSINTGKEKNVSVSVESEHCNRYMGVMIDGIEIAESPAWIKERLSAVGVTPKNNIVDITNYVMLELGQPMHAFDALKISNSKSKDTNIVVRQAEAEEEFTALGGKEYVLTSEDMVITSNDKVVALAGVKGDEFSGVTDATTSILLEAATFDPVSVRRAATRHGLRTDASARFEKSLDTNLAETALSRATELVLELCPNATVVSNVADVTTRATTEITIDLDLGYLRSRVGIELGSKEIAAVLERLGCTTKEKKGIMKVTVPTWRATKDVSIQEDLIEEVARMYGYNNIPVSLPMANIAPPMTDALRETEKELTHLLAHESGYTEVYNYSFVAPEYLETLGIDTAEHLELDNPVAKDRPLLRKYLFTNILQNVESNLHRFDEVALFEIGKTFDTAGAGETLSPNTEERLPLQDTKCIAVFSAKDNDTPFGEVRHVLDQVAERFGLDVSLVRAVDLPAPWDTIIHPGRVASIMVGDVMLGSISELHPALTEKLGIAHRVASLELNVTTLAALKTERVNYRPIPAYPSVSRDISFLVSKETEHAAVVKLLTTMHISEVELLDVYTGEHVGEGQKSMAYRFVYRSDDKTLESSDVDAMHEKVVEQLKKAFDIEVR